MIVIGDYRLPLEAKEELRRFARFVPFAANSIVYNAISGHPDIFFCFTDNYVVVAPNTPSGYKQILKDAKVDLFEGKNTVGNRYPSSARYNAVVTRNFIIHNLEITDETVLKTFPDRRQIHVNQGYTRCSLFALDDNAFITSDKGIFKTLEKYEVEILYADSSDVVLPGLSNGFIGGCFTRKGDRVFVTGSLNFIKNGETIRNFISRRGYEIVQLYDGPLFDGGGLLFL
jgi:hypothetical protein